MGTHLLTGAGSGIGAVLAVRLAARGDALVLLARTDERAADLAQAFPDAQILVRDLAEPGTLNGLGREVEGPLDSVVHAAGVVELASVERLRLHEWEEQLAVNLTSPAVLCREFLPHLRASRGTVVFVNSTSGLSASASWAGYAASKFGLRGLAQALGAEEAERGVRVTSIHPSRTATAMQERVHEQEGKAYAAEDWIKPETVVDAIVHVLDLPADATIPELTIRPR